MVNGLCLLESVQNLGFSYCIQNKVQFWQMFKNKSSFIPNFKNTQFEKPKKSTGNSNLEQTVCNIYETFCFPDQDFSDLIIFQTKKHKIFGKDRGSIRNYFWILT